MAICTGDCKKNIRLTVRERGTFVLLSIVVFMGLYLYSGVHICADYQQYLEMHINREPGYPMFLLLLRTIFGGNEIYFSVAAIVQSIFIALAIAYITITVSELFGLDRLCRFLVWVIFLVPSLVTALLSQTHLIISCSIISEALTFPMFIIFVGLLLRACFGEKNNGRYWIASMIAAFLSSFVRGQLMPMMMVCALLWIVDVIRRRNDSGKMIRKISRCAAIVAFMGLLFAGRLLMIKSYNLYFSGSFVNNTYGSVSFSVQAMFVADEDDIRYISDERTRHMFPIVYQEMQKSKANIDYVGSDDIRDIAYYIEDKHDGVKYYCVEGPTREYLRTLGMQDYVEQNIEIDRIASNMSRAVLSHHLGGWLRDYFGISINGLIRSIAYDKSVLTAVALCLYCIAVIMQIVLWKRDHESRSAYLMGIALLIILANVYATSLMIMCLSRYMIYGFPLFYTALLIMFRDIISGRRSEKVYNGKKDS